MLVFRTTSRIFGGPHLTQNLRLVSGLSQQPHAQNRDFLERGLSGVLGICCDTLQKSFHSISP